MSKAFTKESDREEEDERDAPDPLPAGLKNYITPAGLARLQDELRLFVRSLAGGKADHKQMWMGIRAAGNRAGLLAGGSVAAAEGISYDGTVVVGHTGSSQGGQAYVWTSAGGLIALEDIRNLGDIGNGTVAGRTRDSDITYHKNNNGTGASEIALATLAYTMARAAGRGIEIETEAVPA